MTATMFTIEELLDEYFVEEVVDSYLDEALISTHNENVEAAWAPAALHTAKLDCMSFIMNARKALAHCSISPAKLGMNIWTCRNDPNAIFYSYPMELTRVAQDMGKCTIFVRNNQFYFYP